LRTIQLVITAFICGFCVMGLELLGFRLFAPTFGYSSYVWGSLIGIILAALSVGYVFGGRLADRRPRAPVLYKLIVVAGCYLFVILLLYRKILDACYLGLGTVLGAMVSTIVIYGVPMVLLSMVSPFIIRLLTVQQRAGSIAGGIYGISNTGSILGTFLTAFVLIRVLGSHLTLILLSSLVLVVGIAGVASHSLKWVASLVIVALAPFSFPGRAENLILRRESFYNDLRVLKREDGQKTLSVNRWTSYSVSISKESNYLTGKSYYDYFNAAALLTEPKDILVLGMGAGTSVKQYLHFFPTAQLDAVEIDPEIIRIAKEPKYFQVEEGPRLKIFADDARPFLRKTDKQYDVIEVDMFQGGPYVPFYVTSREFFTLAADHLRPNGLIMMNVLSLRDEWTLLCSIKKTIETAFPTVFTVRVGKSSNYLLVGMKKETNVPGGVTAILNRKRASHRDLGKVISDFVDGIVFLPELEAAHVFTDDKSDIERVTFRMVDKYVKEIPLRE
jgi:spermidine synthase